ncbi:MAG: GNAT family N-acetyltransferase [Bacteroidales bacterium]|nr:GNAT family N-acetyltransferase [Bacteroidales bacterium]
MEDHTTKQKKGSFFKRIRSKLRYGLTLQSIRLKLISVGIDISPYYWYMEGTDAASIPEIKDLGSGFYFQVLGPEDMEAIEKLDMGWSRSTDRIQALTESVEKCIGIKHDGEIAAFMWINLKECRFRSTVIPMKSNEAYLSDMYVAESYRGKNLAPYLRYRSYELLRKTGRDKMYSISIYFNTPAIKFKEKLNAKKIKLVFLIQLFKRFQWSFTIKHYI